MKAKVIREHYAVVDGHVYPRMVLVGEIIHGDLAETALREKWGTAHFEEGAPAAPVMVEKKPVPNDGRGAAAALGLTALEAPVVIGIDGGGSLDGPAPLDIPDDWRALKWFSLKSLAEKVKNGPVANADEARSAIETELAARAGK